MICLGRISAPHETNIDYLAESDMAEAILTDKGLHIFLSSGLEELSKSNLKKTHISRIKPIMTINVKYIRGMCWVAIHQPVEMKSLQCNAANETGLNCNSIIPGFKLEHDFQHLAGRHCYQNHPLSSWAQHHLSLLTYRQ
jgi:hypothetical protein